MRVQFVKNLYQTISFGFSACLLSAIVLWGFAESQKYEGGYGRALLWIGIGITLLYFLIGFYWIFQVVRIDEKGVRVLLFGRTVRFVPWEKIYSVRRDSVMKNPAVVIKILEEKDLNLDDRRDIRKAIGAYFKRRIFADMGECAKIIEYADADTRIEKYEDPKKDAMWNGTDYKSFFGVHYRSRNLSFQLFAYEFEDAATARLYYKGKEGNAREAENETSYFINAACGDQFRASVFYGEKGFTVYTYVEQERGVMQLLYSHFSVSAMPSQDKNL